MSTWEKETGGSSLEESRPILTNGWGLTSRLKIRTTLSFTASSVIRTWRPDRKWWIRSTYLPRGRSDRGSLTKRFKLTARSRLGGASTRGSMRMSREGSKLGKSWKSRNLSWIWETLRKRRNWSGLLTLVLILRIQMTRGPSVAELNASWWGRDSESLDRSWSYASDPSSPSKDLSLGWEAHRFWRLNSAKSFKMSTISTNGWIPSCLPSFLMATFSLRGQRLSLREYTPKSDRRRRRLLRIRAT